MAPHNEEEPAAAGPSQGGSAMHLATVDTDLTRVMPGMGDSLSGSGREGTAPHDPIGRLRRAGRYQVRERIGRGAMATVYKAYDPEIDRALALKFLHPDLCVDEEYRSRFLREAKAAGGLSHQNIVTVFDVGEIDGHPYIAMELLDGTPLSEVMRPGSKLSVKEVTEIGIQLARALDYAHRKGIFHRDIKPSNIIQLAGSNTIKVADFGIAHIDGGAQTQATRVGTVIGTPQYMSPEQAMGEKVDGRSDLFSVGVVLYRLLTGQAPFDATSLVTLAHIIAKQDPVPISKLRDDVPAALRRVIERCMRKRPDKRFASGAELAQALDGVLRDIEQDTDRSGQPRIIPLRMKWSVTMGVLVALTMAITATIVTQRQYAAMMGQVTDYGASLAKFLAVENAEPTLAEDWVKAAISIDAIMERQTFHEISIADRQGVVRASSRTGVVNKPYAMPAGAKQLASRSDGVIVRTYTAPDGVTVLNFEEPITYQKIEVGRLYFGILEEPLSRVARQSFGWLTFLIAVTVLAVMLATYFMAEKYSKPLRLLRESLGEIAKGRLDYRIAEDRNDELGQVYRSFDNMAQALQKRSEPEEAPPPSA